MRAVDRGSLTLSLEIKLSSIVVHTEELISADGHMFDKVALECLLKDSEVRTWVEALQRNGLAPMKRAGV